MIHMCNGRMMRALLAAGALAATADAFGASPAPLAVVKNNQPAAAMVGGPPAVQLSSKPRFPIIPAGVPIKAVTPNPRAVVSNKSGEPVAVNNANAPANGQAAPAAQGAVNPQVPGKTAGIGKAAPAQTAPAAVPAPAQATSATAPAAPPNVPASSAPSAAPNTAPAAPPAPANNGNAGGNAGSNTGSASNGGSSGGSPGAANSPAPSGQ